MTFLEESLRTTAVKLFPSDGASVALEDLLSLGWKEMVTDEPSAVSVLAEEQGRRRGHSRLVEFEIGRHLSLDWESEVLAFSLSGSTSPASTIDVVITDSNSGPTVVVPTWIDHVALCRIDISELESVPIAGMDPGAGWIRLTGNVDVSAGTRIETDCWRVAEAAGRLALAHELIGVGTAILDLAVSHVKNRVQFGVALGTFQAVQHRLAQVHVQLEAARSVTRAAWLKPDACVAAAALIAARSGVESATEHCHQVMGAMGCTWEHGLHRYIRRGITLSLLLDVDSHGFEAMASRAMDVQRIEVFDD